jgi:ubiquinone/menaquinone biosynthesis C-methylase UbiE
MHFWAPPANLSGAFFMAKNNMDTPPVCNYEGSDYQDSFWEKGDRAYEDAAEAVALKRLLPEMGQRLLEVGAGAGRNTPRYRGFKQVVLLDYSFTQLQQARQRLGGDAPCRYVAADVYHLPFRPAVFDAATMIRTLHHMAEPRQALEQVRRVLQPGSIFILEYANKHHLKSILRYALHRQEWSPFTPEPVEFAALNFDFHPTTVRTWLKLSNFTIERQLTVSHLRMGLLKRIMPLGWMVYLESLMQLTGDWWQLSPSVFTRARAVGPAPDGAAVESGTIFCCPGCGHDPLPDTPTELTCPSCGRTYLVREGIYDFRLNG